MFENIYESDRVIMWHEAGHAVAAMHYGRSVISCDIDPLPHCLVNSMFMRKHDKGVMLCAGAAMTKLIFGEEIGADVTDWAMAEKLGDLDYFKYEAEQVCLNYLGEARYIVDARVPVQLLKPSYMDVDGPIYKQTLALAKKERIGGIANYLLTRYANYQINKHNQGEMI